jgi:hypothetical protein
LFSSSLCPCPLFFLILSSLTLPCLVLVYGTQQCVVVACAANAAAGACDTSSSLCIASVTIHLVSTFILQVWSNGSRRQRRAKAADDMLLMLACLPLSSPPAPSHRLSRTCWNRPSALLSINRQLFYRSTIGDEHLREDHETMELKSWFALRTT